METKRPADTREPEIQQEDILILQDEHFNPGNVCIVSGAGTGIGRATSVATAANRLMVVGLDINEEAGQKTCELAKRMGHVMKLTDGSLKDGSQ